LIVEDDRETRLLLQQAAGALGHESVTAEDEARAWEQLSKGDIDVFIADSALPHAGAIELVRRVRLSSELDYVYCILLSDISECPQVLQGLEAGVDDYLTVPPDVGELKVRFHTAKQSVALHRQLRRHQQELQRLVWELSETGRSDRLTGLGNSARLREDLTVLQGRVQRYGHTFCLAILALDRYGSYVESQGTLPGEATLRRVAKMLAHNIRQGDTLYRLGDHQFACVLPEQSAETAVIAVDRLRQRVEELHIAHPGNPDGVVTMSAGVLTVGTADEYSVQGILSGANDALLQARNQGRNRTVVASLAGQHSVQTA
jgi:diguanylate cyclase (GGDEF)-like protein